MARVFRTSKVTRCPFRNLPVGARFYYAAVASVPLIKASNGAVISGYGTTYTGIPGNAVVTRIPLSYLSPGGPAGVLTPPF